MSKEGSSYTREGYQPILMVFTDPCHDNQSSNDMSGITSESSYSRSSTTSFSGESKINGKSKKSDKERINRSARRASADDDDQTRRGSVENSFICSYTTTQTGSGSGSGSYKTMMPRPTMSKNTNVINTPGMNVATKAYHKICCELQYDSFGDACSFNAGKIPAYLAQDIAREVAASSSHSSLSSYQETLRSALTDRIIIVPKPSPTNIRDLDNYEILHSTPKPEKGVKALRDIETGGEGIMAGLETMEIMQKKTQREKNSPEETSKEENESKYVSDTSNASLSNSQNSRGTFLAMLKPERGFFGKKKDSKQSDEHATDKLVPFVDFIEGFENESENELMRRSVNSLSNKGGAKKLITYPAEEEAKKNCMPGVERSESNDTDPTKSITLGSTSQADLDSVFNIEIVDDTERVHIGYYDNSATKVPSNSPTKNIMNDDAMQASMESNNTQSTQDFTVGSSSQRVEIKKELLDTDIKLEIDAVDDGKNVPTSHDGNARDMLTYPEGERVEPNDAAGALFANLFSCSGVPPFHCNANNHVVGQAITTNENPALLHDDDVHEAQGVELFSTHNVTAGARASLTQHHQSQPHPVEEGNMHECSDTAKNHSTTNEINNIDKVMQLQLKVIHESPDVPGFEVMPKNCKNNAIATKKSKNGKRKDGIRWKLKKIRPTKGQQKHSANDDDGSAKHWKVTLDLSTQKPYYYNVKTKDVSWVKPRRFGESRIESQEDIGDTHNNAEEGMRLLLAKKMQHNTLVKSTKEKAQGKRTGQVIQGKAENTQRITGKTQTRKHPIAETKTDDATAQVYAGVDDYSAKYWRATVDATAGVMYNYNKLAKAVAGTKPTSVGWRVDNTEDKDDMEATMALAEKKQKKPWFNLLKEKKAKENKIKNAAKGKAEGGNPVAPKTVAEKSIRIDAKAEVNDYVVVGNSAKHWRATLDTTTGEIYYYNKKTKDVTWTRPPASLH